jgi:hypothetical protein
VTDDKYGALRGHVAAGSGKSVDPILHREPPLLKTVAKRWAILKIKEGLAYLSLDLVYDLINGIISKTFS